MKFRAFLIPTLIQLIAWLLFYLISGEEKWYKNNLPQISFAALVAFLTYLAGTITLFFRPIFLNVKQNNIMKTKETVLDIQRGKCKSLQNQMTISLQLVIERKGSIWWKGFNRFLKSNTIRLRISLKPPKLALIQETFLSNLETNEFQGFDIELNPLFNELFQTNSDYSIEETYRYYISYQNDFHEVTNAQYVIDPLIQIEPNNYSKFTKIQTYILEWLLKREIDPHILRISKR
jgi:hypothetical protein